MSRLGTLFSPKIEVTRFPKKKSKSKKDKEKKKKHTSKKPHETSSQNDMYPNMDSLSTGAQNEDLEGDDEDVFEMSLKSPMGASGELNMEVGKESKQDEKQDEDTETDDEDDVPPPEKDKEEDLKEHIKSMNFGFLDKYETHTFTVEFEASVNELTKNPTMKKKYSLSEGKLAFATLYLRLEAEKINRSTIMELKDDVVFRCKKITLLHTWNNSYMDFAVDCPTIPKRQHIKNKACSIAIKASQNQYLPNGQILFKVPKDEIDLWEKDCDCLQHTTNDKIPRVFVKDGDDCFVCPRNSEFVKALTHCKKQFAANAVDVILGKKTTDVELTRTELMAYTSGIGEVRAQLGLVDDAFEFTVRRAVEGEKAQTEETRGFPDLEGNGNDHVYRFGFTFAAEGRFSY